jgi:hypothetical protein
MHSKLFKHILPAIFNFKYVRTYLKFFCALLFLCFYFEFPFIIKAQEVDENTMVVVYLERFTRFIENKMHPEFDNPELDFNLYIIGKNIYSNSFETIFKEQKIKNRKVNIRFVSRIEELEGANMVFISKSCDKDLEKIVAYTANKGILTTSYSTGFSGRGVNINLYMQDQKLKFEINQNSAKVAGFHISHLLLSKARIID